MPHFRGTIHATDRCPRRQLIDNPDVVQLFALHRAVEGVDGLKRRKKLSAVAVEGLAIIDDALAWRAEEHRKAEAKKAAKQ